MKIYDYIIVGAGASGSVLAYRLSENAKNSVLLIEGGGPDRHPFIHMPKGIGKLMTNPAFLWSYATEPASCTNDKQEFWVRGKTLGGSSAINGMMYVRGQAADYDALAAVTSDDWDWKHIGAAYQALESHELGAAETRGASGPLHISMPTLHDALTDAAIQAGVGLGMKRKEDVNDPADDERIGYAPRTIYRGKRESAAVAFLKPIRQRSNLTIVTGVVIDKLRLEAKRCVGVQAIKNGTVVSFNARREVLLCAGSMGSPAILQRSGIGPAAHLHSLGIPLLQHSPQLGYNLREHRALVMQWRTPDDVSQNRQYLGTRLLANTLQYALTRSGPMSAATYEAGGWFKTDVRHARPNAQILIAPYSFDFGGPSINVEKSGGMHLCAYILRPESSGSVLIRSADPTQLPEIVPNHAAATSDREQMIELLRYIRSYMAQAPLAGMVLEETRPGLRYESDNEILAAFAAMGNGAYHASGSCSMGRDSDSVLDTRLRVRDIDALRVVDTSCFPFLVAGNTNGPAMALAWRVADLSGEER